MSTGRSSFGTTVEHEAGVPTLHVRGEIDVLTAPALQRALFELLDQGHADVVLDLQDVGFMDAAGLGALAIATRTVRAAGGALTLRSAPPQVRVLLSVSGLERLLAIEALGGAGSPEVRGASAAERARLARMGSIPAGNAVVDAALGLVTRMSAELIDGADGASVTLHRHGRLITVAATNDTVARMDRHQYETYEGPCIAASHDGRPFHIEALAEEPRWSAFVPRAIAEGIASIYSSPLVAEAKPVGALNIYSTRQRAFGARQQDLAAMFAGEASSILDDAGAGLAEDEVDAGVLRALRSREVIAVAQGVLMARHRVTREAAADILVRRARTDGTTVNETAVAVVATTEPTALEEPARD